MEDKEGIPNSEIENQESVVKTNKGREVSSDDVLCFTERRGTEKFASLLAQGKIVSPGLARERGESFVDEHGIDRTLLSTEREPYAIYTSLHGPYWPEGFTLVFNAWDTLNDVRFNDNGNTGVRLYNRETDEGPAEISFLDESLEETRDFLILVPNESIEREMRRYFYKKARGSITGKEQDEFFERHIIKPKVVLEKAKQFTRDVIEENPDIISVIKRQARDVKDKMKDEKFKEAMEKIAQAEGLHDLAVEYIVHGLLGELYALRRSSLTGKFVTLRSSDQQSGSIPHSITSRYLEYCSTDQEREGVLEASARIGNMMQDLLRDEFQERFGSKKGREAKTETKGEGADARVSLTINQ